MAKFNEKSGFLTFDEKNELRKISIDRSERHVRVRRALILLGLDDGFKPNSIASILRIDNKTIYNLRERFEHERLDALNDRKRPPRARRLSDDQLKELDEYIKANPPSKVSAVIEHVNETYGVKYSMSGMTKLMQARGFQFKVPRKLPRIADEAAQEEHIASYQALKDELCEKEEEEAIFHLDAVHPEHQVRPAGVWFHSDVKPAVPSSTGRERLNIIGAIDVSDGTLLTKEVDRANGKSIGAFLKEMHAKLSKRYKRVHIILDNAGYHHAKSVKEVLKELEGWVVFHFLPPYAPHLNSIERLWGVMHKWVTHNKCYESFEAFRDRIRQFLNEDVPQRWDEIKSTVTDNYKVITHDGFQLHNNA